MSETSPITCFACEREPTQQCSRCGRPYCDEHGEELCDVCLQPATGVPSFSLYRGSLLALLIGTALAVWLLVQPPSSEGDSALRPAVITPTAELAAAQPTNAAGTPQPNTTGTSQPNTTPTAGGTRPAGTAATATRAAGTTTPSGTAQAGSTPGAGSGSYTVVSGDTLSGICSAQRPSLSNADCVASLRSLNGLAGDTLSLGQTLRLP